MSGNRDIFSKFFNSPVAISEAGAAFLRTHAAELIQNPAAVFDAWEEVNFGPQAAQIDSIAVIPVRGVLLQRSPGWWGCTGYDWLRTHIEVAIEDPAIDAIVLDVDSPGGEVAGCFDLADAIYDARGEKPIWSILSENAYSAAYAIASAADRIIVPRTGGTGSVGVICMHVDISKALENAGIDVTVIHYGDRKADGNETMPLSKAALQRYQDDVDAMGELS